MKTKFALIALTTCAMAASANAFSLNFIGFEDTVLPPSLTIPVAGYGDVVITPLGGSPMVINNTTFERFGSFVTALNFGSGDSIRVKFEGLPVFNVDFDFVGVSVGETFLIAPDMFEPQAVTVTFLAGGDGAGLAALGFRAIPEPSTALLGGLGMLLMFRRRR